MLGRNQFLGRDTAERLRRKGEKGEGKEEEEREEDAVSIPGAQGTPVAAQTAAQGAGPSVAAG